MMRSAQVALIPVFQFGVFSESDLSFFRWPRLGLRRPRAHQRGLVSVAGQATVTFHSKLAAYGNVVRTVLANGNCTANNNYTGTVYIPTARFHQCLQHDDNRVVRQWMPPPPLPTGMAA